MMNVEQRLAALEKSSIEMGGIVQTGRNLASAIQSRYGITSHGEKAVSDVLAALEACQQAERELVQAHLEKQQAMKAVRGEVQTEETQPVVEADNTLEASTPID